MPDSLINGCSFHYEVDDFTAPWRDAETIWIQHGFGRSSKHWFRWVPPLAAEYRVVRRDLRGHGKSSDPGPDYRWTLDSQLADMIGFLDTLGVERVHYIGESVGGLFGIAFAARHPDRLKSLILCASPPNVARFSLDDLMVPLGQVSPRAAMETVSMPDFVRSAIDYRTLTALGPEHLEWVIAQWCRNRPRVLNGLFELAAATDLTDQLGSITAPTLILAPTRSPITTLDAQRRMADLTPNSELVEVEGVGHEIYVDQAETCIRAVRSFLDRLPHH